MSLAWQTLQPSTLVEAIIGLNRATGYEEFRAALSKWDVAAQNVVYADVEGNIAYQATGEVPIRAGGDGSWPVAGMDRGERVDRCRPLRRPASPLQPADGLHRNRQQPGAPPGSCALLLDRFGLRLSGGPNRGDDRGHTVRVSRWRRPGDPDGRPGRRGAQPRSRISSPSSRRTSAVTADAGSDRAVVHRPDRLSGRA